ncbi:hypothetical protein CANARDRAFT_9022 [[Candida] arabinofermentans NRRL YB-2248]|uniref:Uncharacterized protein n=1 Tax=[Candida] arabinofermentans NRRL YB-2248 TaxID=983967 RepID=A0A1E4SWZ0_9ASCO|nr:hypothetical protein CANARDRAFT_9022 [[Candida] arabinofermentans NRRL YB-2248]
MTDLQLSISKIYGTSSETSSQFIAQGSLIAYTASAGVVVCKLSARNLEVQWQRFFNANGTFNEDQLGKALDEYEFPLNLEPEVVTRDGLVAQDDGKDSELSRSKFKKIDELNSSVGINRVRSINAIAISPDQKLLAVGEVGYQPRILIYSLASNSSGKPIGIIQEHQFGINSLCFSSDSKKLISLGLINDGFLCVWDINKGRASFSGSNKCSSVVNKLVWHDGFIITLGLRHIKVWKEDSTRNGGILKGRNVLLKGFMNSNFIDLDCLNFNELLVLSDQGDVCFLNLIEATISLRKLYQLSPHINQFLIDHTNETLIVGGKSLDVIHLDQVLNGTNNDPIKATPSSPTKIVKRSGILSLQEVVGDKLVYLKNGEIFSVDSSLSEQPKLLIDSLVTSLSGLKNCHNKDVLIWSKDGLIKKLVDGKVELFTSISLPTNELIENSLTSLDLDANGNLVVGDKYGNLMFYSLRQDFIKGYKEISSIRAHESSINDLIIFEVDTVEFMCSCSRDRTIQIFTLKEGNWELHQTLSTNKANVIKIEFYDNKLVASSSDRTISIHRFEVTDGEPLIYQEKILSVKNTSLTFGVYDDDLVISTNDKNLSIYNFGTYELKRTLKLFNGNFESLQVDKFQIHNKLIYASCSDKSIRVFTYNDGRLISSSWGHSEAVNGLLLINNNKNLLSVSHDGCMFNWELKDIGLTNSTATPSTTATTPTALESYSSPPKVLRKILHPTNLTQTSRLTRSPSSIVRSSPSTRLLKETTSPMSSSRSTTSSTAGTPVASGLPSVSRSPARSPTYDRLSRPNKTTRISPARVSAKESSPLGVSSISAKLSSLKIDDANSKDDLIESTIKMLKKLQLNLLDSDSGLQNEVNKYRLRSLSTELNTTLKLLPDYNESMLNRYGDILLEKLLNTVGCVDSGKDKVNNGVDKENIANLRE